MFNFGHSMEAPYAGRPRRRWYVVLFRLAVGLPIIDHETRVGPSFFRSAGAVQRKPSLNPCQNWPGWARLGWRVAVGATWYGWVNYRLITIATFVTLVAAVVGLLVAKWGHLQHKAEICQPLFVALLAKMGGQGQVDKVPASEYRRYLTVPRNYASGGEIVLRLPPTFDPNAAQMDAMTKLVERRLRIDVESSWDWEHGRVSWVRVDAPTMVRYDPTVRGSQRKIPIGQNTRGDWEYIDLEGQTPHVLVSARTGWGKTVILLFLAAWTVARGARVDICDPKRIGYLCLQGVRHVTLHSHVDAFVRAISEFRASMEAWYQAKEHGENVDDETRFPTRILILDELGSLIQMVRQQWKAEGNKGQPKTLDDIMYILWQGRAARHYVFTGAQQANKEVLISTDGRDQYGAKIASGPQSVSSWRMMFGYEKKVKVPKRKGAAVFGIGDDPYQIQLVYITEDEARRMAETPVATNSVSADVPESPRMSLPGDTPDPVPDTAQNGDSEPKSPDQACPTPENDEPEEELIKGIAAAAAYLKMTEEAFKKARQRRPIEGERRIQNAPAWTELDLLNWRAQAKIAGRPEPADIT